MRKILIAALLSLPLISFAQEDSAKWLRSFPITDYMVQLNDSTTIVQIIPPGGTDIKEKQLALLEGVYNDSPADTIEKGFGRCQLIKSDYYYFPIHLNRKSILPKKGDLLYIFVEKNGIYSGRIPLLALHCIELTDVHDNLIYNKEMVFYHWNETDEKNVIDKMMEDIRFTGKYFLESNPSMNKIIDKGPYKGKPVLNCMIDCASKDVNDFLNYMIARPRFYAGRKWKVSEIFATWLTEGAPTTRPTTPVNH